MNHTGAIILAGGNSMRMGRFPKPLLYIEGQTFLEREIGAFREAGINDVRVILNSRFYSGAWKNVFDVLSQKADIVLNHHPEFGRMFSIRLGISEIPKPENIFIHNSDNPFIRKEIISSLLFCHKPGYFTAPVFEGRRGHPVLLSRNIVERIEQLESTQITLRDVLKKFPANEVPVNTPDVLININTPEDYKQFVINRRPAV